MTMDWSDYHRFTEGVADALAEHIPIIELSLIIQDYCTPPSPGLVHQGLCCNCHKKHRRQYSMLCMACKDLCIYPKCGRFTMNEKSIFCLDCMGKYPDLYNTHKERDKYRVFLEWYKVQFPSIAYYKEAERTRKRDAERAEEKRKEDAFLAIEDAKPKDQQIAELRAKLYAANKLLHTNRFQLTMRPPPIAEFPYF